jgi:predicted DNA-binding transcriptional regulator AlpA
MTATLLKPKDVAQRLTVSERRLSRWRQEGGGPVFVRLGHRSVAYAETAIAEFVAGRTCRSTSDALA